MRSVMRAVLESERDIDVVGEAGELESAVCIFDREHPDVVVLEMGMSSLAGTTGIAALLEDAPGAGVVVATMQYDPAFAQSALRAGALGFVSKDLADSELAPAVRAAARGERYVSPRVRALLDARRRG